MKTASITITVQKHSKNNETFNFLVLWRFSALRGIAAMSPNKPDRIERNRNALRGAAVLITLNYFIFKYHGYY